MEKFLTSKEVRSFIIGTVLGDSSLTTGKRGKNSYLYMGHSEKQKDYLLWKKEIVESHLPIGATFTLAKGMTSLSKKRLPFYKVTTNRHHKLKAIENLIYVDGIKRITQKALDKMDEVGLAFLFMDDGCKETALKISGERVIKSFKISLGGFPKEDVELLSRWLLEKYDITTKVYLEHKQYPCLKVTTKENRNKFVNLIKDYLHPSLLYKIQV